MLARLERTGLLALGTEVKNVTQIMHLYHEIINDRAGDGMLKNCKDETVELKNPAGSKIKYTFNLGNLDDYIFGYARRGGIPLPGLVFDKVEVRELPIRMTEDPWNTGVAFRKYEEERGTMRNGEGIDGTPLFGGDQYDVTAWPSEKRAAASLTKRDPLSKKEQMALKMGFVLDWE